MKLTKCEIDTVRDLIPQSMERNSKRIFLSKHSKQHMTRQQISYYVISSHYLIPIAHPRFFWRNIGLGDATKSHLGESEAGELAAIKDAATPAMGANVQPFLSLLFPGEDGQE